MGSGRKMRGSIRHRLPDDGAEGHLRQDVALDVDAGRDLDQFQALWGQREDAALGDIEHLLAGRLRIRR